MNPARARHVQGRIGLALAGAIIGGWSGLHAWSLFFLAPVRQLASWLAVGLIVTLIAVLNWLSVGLFIIAHDAMHGSLCPRRRRLADAVGALALWLYAGFSFRRLLPRHHAHHRHPGTDHDPDFSPDSPTAAGCWYLRFMLVNFGPREAVIMTLRVQIYLLLGAPLGNVLLFFALPALLSSFQLFYFGTYLPHRHHRDDSSPATRFADHHHARSNDYGTLASLLSCFHFGYHHEHHLHPGVPWWRLPATRRRRVRGGA